MRRSPGLFIVAVIMVFGMVFAGGLLSGAGAQDASPPAGPPPGGFEIAPGVMAEAIAFAEGREDPSVYRLTFDAGVTYMIHESPALEVAYMESGSLTLTLSVPVTIGQIGATDTSGEAVAANTEMTLEAGNYLVVPPMTTGEIRNEGTEPATVSIANIIPGPAATPEATPSS